MPSARNRRARGAAPRTRAAVPAQGRPRRSRSVRSSGGGWNGSDADEGSGDAADATSGTDTGVDLSHLSQKERRRIKNRQSAADSRQRKRRELEGLLKQVRDLTRKNTSLNNKVKTLTTTVQRLKATKTALEANVAELTAELEVRRGSRQAHSGEGVEGGAGPVGGGKRGGVPAGGGAGPHALEERPAATRRKRRRTAAVPPPVHLGQTPDAGMRDTPADPSASDLHITNLLLSHAAAAKVPRHHPGPQARSASMHSPRARPLEGNGDHSSATSAAESIGSFPLSNLLLGSSHGGDMSSSVHGHRSASYIGTALAARVPAFGATSAHHGPASISTDSFLLGGSVDSSALYGAVAQGLFPADVSGPGAGGGGGRRMRFS